MSWAAVLFDLDGTLADTVQLILNSYRHTMRVHRGRELPDERWLATLGRPLEDSMAMFADGRDEAHAMVETYVAYQRTVHDDLVRPYPGARELTSALAAAGVPMGVVTSKRREMALRTLDRCGLLLAADLLVTPEDVRRGKPDPEPVRYALHRLGLLDRPTEVLFVGDSPFDLEAGRGAGVRTAAAAWGPFERERLRAERPDYLLDAPLDLLLVEA
jgi:pyrophosphatase PpaX